MFAEAKASANIRKLSNINSRIFAEAEAEALSSALQLCLQRFSLVFSTSDLSSPHYASIYSQIFAEAKASALSSPQLMVENVRLS